MLNAVQSIRKHLYLVGFGISCQNLLKTYLQTFAITRPLLAVSHRVSKLFSR